VVSAPRSSISWGIDPLAYSSGFHPNTCNTQRQIYSAGLCCYKVSCLQYRQNIWILWFKHTVDSRYYDICYNEILLITIPNLYPNQSQTIEIQTGYIDSLVILIHFPYPISIVITRVYCISFRGGFNIFHSDEKDWMRHKTPYNVLIGIQYSNVQELCITIYCLIQYLLSLYWIYSIDRIDRTALES
jgi:hypothetical protein